MYEFSLDNFLYLILYYKLVNQDIPSNYELIYNDESDLYFKMLKFKDIADFKKEILNFSKK